MSLTRVSITGADDKVAISDLVELSKEFPFVEWAILISKSQAGQPRYPSFEWCQMLGEATDNYQLNIASHLCGRWMRNLLIGELAWADLPSSVLVSQRIQINTNGEKHISTQQMIPNMRTLSPVPQYIFQLDNVNHHLLYAAKSYGIHVAGLWDASGGKGIIATEWPAPLFEITCGYAGGLGPDNVAQNIPAINAICHQPYWIDMESQVRTDNHLDLDSVRSVLKQAVPYIVKSYV